MTTPLSYPWEGDRHSISRRCLLDFTWEELRDLIVGWGFKKVNARDLFIGFQRRRHTTLKDFELNRLPARLILRLCDPDAPSPHPFQRVRAFPSSDGSVKYLYHLWGGDQVESVFMPAYQRNTLCISSQVGCALGCTFCATGAMGFKRHLSTAEMVGQVIHMLRDNLPPHRQASRCNIVFMGMGEPLHNYENVMRTFDILTHPNGMVLSYKDISLSTSGLVPKIEKMAGRCHRPRLMVSIAATREAARSAVMPVNRAYPLESLVRCLERYPLRKRERIMLSYVLIAGINDREVDADHLVAMSRRFPSLVNLIPMNPHADSPGMREPAEERLQWFFRKLSRRGVFTTVRRSRGRDVAGACGQLSALAV